MDDQVMEGKRKEVDKKIQVGFFPDKYKKEKRQYAHDKGKPAQRE